MAVRIVDEFTKLGVSRQRKHQLRKLKMGLCMICTRERERGSATYCKRHAKRHAKVRMERYYGEKA